MPSGRILIVVSFAGVLLLTVLFGSGSAGNTQILTSVMQSTQGKTTIPYAGMLTDPAGKPVADGLYGFSFALYASETGGEPYWTETQTGMPVTAGLFEAGLGRAETIPAEVLDSGARWLAVAVKGPGESGYTPLLPRQRLSIPLAAVPANLTASGACPHDHVGEVWYGNVTWSNGAFKVVNYANGPTLWGWNGGGGNGVRGYATGTGLGVYGESIDGTGVMGRSTNGNGMEGFTTLAGKYGVYGKNESGATGGVGVVGYAPNGTGVYGQGSVFGVYVKGNLRVEGTSIFDGAKTGYVVDVAQNDDAVPLEAGDLVMISGAGPAVLGDIPVVKVRRATAARAGAVVGVVDKHFTPASEEKAAEGGAGMAVDDRPIGPGEYLFMVTLGAFKALKVDAAYGPITPGDRLMASPHPGHARRVVSPQPGTGVGKALGSLDSGTGMIPVFVTLQ